MILSRNIKELTQQQRQLLQNVFGDSATLHSLNHQLQQAEQLCDHYKALIFEKGTDELIQLVQYPDQKPKQKSRSRSRQHPKPSELKVSQTTQSHLGDLDTYI